MDQLRPSVSDLLLPNVAKQIHEPYNTAVRIEDMGHKGKIACLLKQNRIKSQEDAKQTKQQSQQTHSHGG